MSKILTGIVVSNKMQNTVVVDVKKKFQHRRYRKIVNMHKKYKVHVGSSTIPVGSTVKIQETKPISKDVHFMLASTQAFSKEPAAKETKIVKPSKTSTTKKKETTETASAVAVEPAQKTPKTEKKTAKKSVTRKKKVTS